MFADKYLQKNNRIPRISSKPDENCGMIIVIPCYQEPDVLLTLDSLKECDLPHQKVEVLVLINHSEVAGEEIKEYNKQTAKQINDWILRNKTSGLTFFAIGPVVLQKKWAGVGLARKSGMDEALSRFNQLRKSGGIIVSLDSDTLVAKNYLTEIERHFSQNKKDAGVTISFLHQTSGLSDKQKTGILLYEKYMIYYKNALEYVGYPNAMFTVGSAFAVTAEAYVKRGGMTRRQAGEDFYFLQNLALVGRVGELNTTQVFPSARVSNRVPFGTGPIVGKWMNDEEDLTKTYNFQAFVDLKSFFDKTDIYFKIEESSFYTLISELPETIQQFIEDDNFWAEIKDLNQNCSSVQSFKTRFFHKFNAFKILKFLNFAHEKHYKKEDLEVQIQKLKKSAAKRINFLQ